MKSPQDMRIIQIDITNACIHNCSNCTRFCGHHKKPFFMDYDTFKMAVDSMEGYVGTVSMMGGEPTVHPEFERFIEYLGSKYAGHSKSSMLVYPQKSFLDGVHEAEMDNIFLYPCPSDPSGYRQTIHGPGLWSAMGAGYKKYYEMIQDTIAYQALNDHSMPMYHQPILISRKAMGIPDDEWIRMRNNCWVQNQWSACITPKGAFFCEVAGALDMLFDGPGGWPIEHDWWRRSPEEFGDQLEWCEMCGLALDTFSRNANEEIDDISADIYEKLKKTGSRKIGTEHIHIVDIEDGKIKDSNITEGKWFEGSMPYTESYAAKLDETKRMLARKKIDELVFADLLNDDLGERIIDKARCCDDDTYLLILVGDVKKKEVMKRLEDLVLNPGTLLYRYEASDCDDEYFQFTGAGYTLLFSCRAKAFKAIPEERILNIRTPEELKNAWEPDKVVRFCPDCEYEAIRSEIVKGSRYVVYGAGQTAYSAIKHIYDEGAVCVRAVDGDPKKWNSSIMNVRIDSPEYLKNNRNDFDCILIASTRYFNEIRDDLINRGFERNELCWWI